MTELLSKIQKILDDSLYPNITSHYQRKEKIDFDSSKTDAYIVYKIPSSYPSNFGDGKEILHRYRIDINLYYSESVSMKKCTEFISIIKNAFMQERFIFSNGPSDLYDLDNPYRGINLEFLYVG